MPKFYKKENGVLIAPKNKSRFHISWTEENIIAGFRHFYEIHKRWPIGIDLNDCKYLPNVKTLERKFGGITKVRQALGLNDINYTKGEIRSTIAKELYKRGTDLEIKLYKILLDRFLEPYVHNQARININNNQHIMVDFIVFHKNGKFAVDVFYPDAHSVRFKGNVYMKFKTYKSFPYLVYLCVGNLSINCKLIEDSNKYYSGENKYLKLISFNELIEEISKYEPLPNPYAS